MNTDLSLRLVVAPEADDRRIVGRLHDERGDEHPFSSWLGLLSLLDAARTRAHRAAPTTDVSAWRSGARS